MAETDKTGHAGAEEIEITPEMIQAGACCASEYPLGGQLSRMVEDVYLMMEIERRSND